MVFKHWRILKLKCSTTSLLTGLIGVLLAFSCFLPQLPLVQLLIWSCEILSYLNYCLPFVEMNVNCNSKYRERGKNTAIIKYVQLI